MNTDVRLERILEMLEPGEGIVKTSDDHWMAVLNIAKTLKDVSENAYDILQASTLTELASLIEQGSH